VVSVLPCAGAVAAVDRVADTVRPAGEVGAADVVAVVDPVVCRVGGIVGAVVTMWPAEGEVSSDREYEDMGHWNAVPDIQHMVLVGIVVVVAVERSPMVVVAVYHKAITSIHRFCSVQIRIFRYFLYWIWLCPISQHW